MIELLIVVAIIAILAAIAVPNFLEAQTRAKVSRVKADIRSAATAIEAYYVDWNAYPFDGYNHVVTTNPRPYNHQCLPRDISTPIAYMTSCQIADPFRQVVTAGGNWQATNVRYTNHHSTYGSAWDAVQSPPNTNLAAEALYTEIFGIWRLNGAGPDKSYGPSGYPTTPSVGFAPVPYDPTNGTVSLGDILRTQKYSNGYAGN